MVPLNEEGKKLAHNKKNNVKALEYNNDHY